MPNFDKYVDRHGEFWVQGIIEQIERVEGIPAMTDVTLEERWEALMQPANVQQQLAA